MNLNNDHIKEVFGTRFNNFEEDPDASVWEGVQAGMAKKKKRKRAVFILSNILLIIVVAVGAGRNLKPQEHHAAGTGYTVNEKVNRYSGTATQKLNKEATPLYKEAGSRSLYAPNHLKITSAGKTPVFQDMTAIPVRSMGEDGLLLINMTEIADWMLPAYTAALYKARPAAHFDGLNVKPPKISSPSKIALGLEAGTASLAFSKYSGGAFKANRSDVAFNFYYRVSDRLSVMSGIGFQQLNMQAYYRVDKPRYWAKDSILAINNERSVFYFKYYDTAVVTYRTPVHHLYTSVSIPVGFDYVLNPKNKLQLNIGSVLTYSRLLKGKLYTANALPLGSKTEAVAFNETNTFKGINNLQINIRLSLGYAVSKHIRLTLTPDYSYGLNPMLQTGTGRQAHLSGCGIKSGLMYAF